MKKVITMIIIGLCLVNPVLAGVDRSSESYLKNKKHFSVANPIVEYFLEKSIEKSLKKHTGQDFNIGIKSYTLSSLKNGVIKDFELEANNIVLEEIDVAYLNIKTLTDYNKMDLTQDPIKVESKSTLAYNIHLTEKSINQALRKKEYQKTLLEVNKRAYPLFTIHDVQIRIRNNKAYIIMYYNFPIETVPKNRSFMVSTGFNIINNRICAHNIALDNAYGNLPMDKVANLINGLDPLTFALNIMNAKKCNTRIENIKIVDNIIQIDGKIFVEGE